MYAVLVLGRKLDRERAAERLAVYDDAGGFQVGVREDPVKRRLRVDEEAFFGGLAGGESITVRASAGSRRGVDGRTHPR